MQVGELSQRTGVSVRAIRYYEQAGLVDAVRLPNGYRDFPPAAVERVMVIRELLSSGFTLDEVLSLADCLQYGTPSASCRVQTVELYREKLLRLDTQLRTLGELRDRVAARLASLESSSS